MLQKLRWHNKTQAVSLCLQLRSCLSHLLLVVSGRPIYSQWIDFTLERIWSGSGQTALLPLSHTLCLTLHFYLSFSLCPDSLNIAICCSSCCRCNYRLFGRLYLASLWLWFLLCHCQLDEKPPHCCTLPAQLLFSSQAFVLPIQKNFPPTACFPSELWADRAVYLTNDP